MTYAINSDKPHTTPQEYTQHANNYSLTKKISKFVWASIGTCLTYKLLDKGLADLFCLETLIHGTGPKGFIGITLNGADPNFGGGATGSTAGLTGSAHQERFLKNAKNYFYLFKDSELPSAPLSGKFFKSCFLSDRLHCLAAFPRSIITCITAKMHATEGGVSTFSSAYGSEAKKLIGGLSGAFTPTLKFRFKLEDVLASTTEEICTYKRETRLSIRKFLGDSSSYFNPSLEDYFNPQDIKNHCWIKTNRVFENDPDYGGDIAYRTERAIPASHLGITGTLTQGVDENTLTRMSENPTKAMTGVFFLTLALAVGYLTYTNYKRIPIQQVRERFLNQHWVDKINTVVTQIALTTFWFTTALSLIFLSTL